jgi:5-methylcytosine-specific restriction endonuclease McrA
MAGFVKKPKFETGRVSRASMRREMALVKPKFKYPDKDAKSLYPPDWSIIKAAIKQRDGYKCRAHKIGLPRCPNYFPPPFSNMLDAHHIIPLPKGSNKPKNLITLCRQCHEKTHNRKIGKSWSSEQVKLAKSLRRAT